MERDSRTPREKRAKRQEYPLESRALAPHRLRHVAATEFRRQAGRDMSRLMLGVIEGIIDVYVDSWEGEKERVLELVRKMG